MINHYDALGLDSFAPAAEIKIAFRRLCLLHHPDRQHYSDEAAAESFQKTAAAYAVLRDDAKRSESCHAL